MARPKKKKNTRTDAALDAMRPYGFPDNLILGHLKQLLRVYGDDNWFFIEENAYKVLLDAILEHLEQDTAHPLPRRQGETDMGAGPSSEVLALSHANREVLELASQFNEDSDAALLTNGGSRCLSPTGEGSDSNHINLEPVLETNGIDHIENTNFSSLEATHFPRATDGVKIRRKRRPYHAWIDSDEEDGEVVLVELEPMPLPPELARLLHEATSATQGGI